jgi:hypothetical protein
MTANSVVRMVSGKITSVGNSGISSVTSATVQVDKW